MKESNYSMQQQRFNTLVNEGQSLEVPTVNVRESVRSALEQRATDTLIVDELSETVVTWFSGIRGGFVAGALGLAVICIGFFVISQTSTLLSNDVEEDEVSTFIDSGDWSQLL